MKKHIVLPLLAIVVVTLSVSCSRLSGTAKKIAGCYILPEISQTEPLYELNCDGSCLIRAIKPGVTTYSVSGRWNVIDDSLVVTLDSSTLAVDGDPSIVGQVPERSAHKLAGYDEFNLQLEKGGVVYNFKKLNR